MRTQILLSLLLTIAYARADYVLDVFFADNPTNVVTLAIQPGQPASRDFDEYLDLGGNNALEDKVGLGIQITVKEFSISNEVGHISIKAKKTTQLSASSAPDDLEFHTDSFDVTVDLPIDHWSLMGPARETGGVTIVTKDKAELPGATGFRIRSNESYRARSISIPGMNLAFDIQQGDFGFTNADDLLVAGGDGVRVLSASGEERYYAQFISKERPWHVSCADLNDDGERELLGVLPTSEQVRLFNWAGAGILDLPGAYYRPALAGDVMSDTMKEIVIAQKGGIRIYDMRGNKLGWIPIENMSPFMCLGDADGDGKLEIISQRNNKGGRGSMLVHKGDGELLCEWQPSFKFYSFSTVTWNADGKMCLVFLQGGHLFITTVTGEAVITLDTGLPVSGKLVKAVGGWAYVHGNRDRFICVASTATAERHVVCVFASDGTLEYQRRIDESFASLLVPQTSSDGTFYVGGRDKIWVYQVAPIR